MIIGLLEVALVRRVVALATLVARPLKGGQGGRLTNLLFEVFRGLPQEKSFKAKTHYRQREKALVGSSKLVHQAFLHILSRFFEARKPELPC